MRIGKEEYYLRIAEAVSLRSTCLRARGGAIIVKDDAIVSTGYIGSPRGSPNCCDVGVCKRLEMGVPPGQRYELCESVHGEQNAIINAALIGQSVLRGTMYVYFERLDDSDFRHGKPCTLCMRMIINAGIKTIIDEEVVKDISKITRVYLK